MAVEVKEMAESAVESGKSAADVATGGAVVIAETSGGAVRRPQRTARRLARRGAQVNRRVNRRMTRQAEETAEETVHILEGLLPERLAIAGLRLVRGRARRTDLVGTAAYRVLELVNGGLEAVRTSIAKLERASTPPARPVRGRAAAASRATRRRPTAVSAASRPSRRTVSGRRRSSRGRSGSVRTPAA